MLGFWPGQEGLIGHRGVDLLQQEGLAGILGGKIHDLDVGLAEAGLLEQDVQVEVRYAAPQDRHRLALEIGDGLDVLGSEDPVAAAGSSSASTHPVLHPARRTRRIQHGACDGIDLAGEQAAEGGGVDPRC